MDHVVSGYPPSLATPKGKGEWSTNSKLGRCNLSGEPSTQKGNPKSLGNNLGVHVEG